MKAASTLKKVLLSPPNTMPITTGIMLCTPTRGAIAEMSPVALRMKYGTNPSRVMSWMKTETTPPEQGEQYMRSDASIPGTPPE